MLPALDRLDDRHLPFFWTVAKAGSLKRVGVKLRVSLRRSSRQLAELEAVLGEERFRRRGRTHVLTEPGQVAFCCAEEVVPLRRERVNAVKPGPLRRLCDFGGAWPTRSPSWQRTNSSSPSLT